LLSFIDQSQAFHIERVIVEGIETFSHSETLDDSAILADRRQNQFAQNWLEQVVKNALVFWVLLRLQGRREVNTRTPCRFFRAALFRIFSLFKDEATATTHLVLIDAFLNFFQLHLLEI